MKKVLASLGIIALVCVLCFAAILAYGSYKDLELKKEEAKLDKNKEKSSEKEQQITNNNQNAEQTTQVENTTTSNNNNENDISNEPNTDEVRTNENGEEIKKTKNGIDYVGEFDSPEEEAKYERDVMSQSGGAPTSDEDKVNEDIDPSQPLGDAGHPSVSEANDGI